MANQSTHQMNQRKDAFSAFLFMLLAVVVGVTAGYGAIGFYYAIDSITILFFSTDEKSLATGAKQLADWQILIAPVIAGLIVGQLLRFQKDHKARGVPHVMEAAQLTSERMRLREGIMSALTAVISLGGGASAGREGPVVHLGASLASQMARYLKLTWEDARTLLGCGAAAAVAASFNAPIAGVFFALEVVLGHYALRAFAPTVLAAVAGTLVARAHIGDLPVFDVTDYSIRSYIEFPLFIVLGMISAGLAVSFAVLSMKAEQFRDRFLPLPYWIQPACGGVVLGGLGILHPEILGVGYETTLNAINGGYGISVLLTLLALKFLAVLLSLTSRFGGGIFSPSLVMGALLGGSFGLLIAGLSPTIASSEGLYAVVGMGAVTSAVLGAPISTILIVFELTGDYSVAVAVMVACAASNLTSSLISDGSFFHRQLRSRGIFLEYGRDTHLLGKETVSAFVDRDFFTLSDGMTVADAREMLLVDPTSRAMMINHSGAFLGFLSLDNLPMPSDGKEDEPANQFVDQTIPPLSGDTVIGQALTIFDTLPNSVLPVIKSQDDPTVLGLVHQNQLLKAHNRALKISLGRRDT